MSTNISLDATTRTVFGKKVKTLRQEGLLPATVYGKGIEPLSVQIDYRTFEKVYRQVGNSALVTLNISDSQKQVVFIHETQHHPLSRKFIHADFRAVDLLVPINAEVPILLTGESKLVERGDATINHGITSIEVHGLPADLPHHIEIDMGILNSLDTIIQVSDIVVKGAYTIITPGNITVASLTPSRLAASLAQEEASASSAEPDLIRKERENE
jgi:large subunit ribosomal protein L25